MKAKETLKKLLERKKKTMKMNVTLSLEKELYDEAKEHLKSKGLMISEFIEEVLKDLLNKN